MDSLLDRDGQAQTAYSDGHRVLRPKQGKGELSISISTNKPMSLGTRALLVQAADLSLPAFCTHATETKECSGALEVIKNPR